MSRTTEWRRANPEKWAAQRKAYNDRRNAARRAKWAARTDEQREADAVKRRKYGRDPERERAYQRLDILRKCGMSLTEAREWYASVDKVCGICGSTDDPCIDHCHDKMEIRGILCRKCNLLLGYADDDVKRLLAAIKYLEVIG